MWGALFHEMESRLTGMFVYLCLLPDRHVTSHATLSAWWLPHHDGASLRATAWDWTGHAGALPPSLLPMAGPACLSWGGQPWKRGVAYWPGSSASPAMARPTMEVGCCLPARLPIAQSASPTIVRPTREEGCCLLAGLLWLGRSA